MAEKPLPEGMVVTEQSSTRFRVEDGEQPEYYLDATLTGGILTFKVVAVLGGRRGRFRGHEFFDVMMAYFGKRVKVIFAQWSEIRSAFRTNLDMFNERIRRGDDPEAAAFATKTGQWASTHRFTVIRGLDAVPLTLPGQYEQVVVEFVRTKRTRLRK